MAIEIRSAAYRALGSKSFAIAVGLASAILGVVVMDGGSFDDEEPQGRAEAVTVHRAR